MIRKRWAVAVRGNESGNITPLDFFLFRRKEQAGMKVAALNQQKTLVNRQFSKVTEYVVWDRRQRSVAE